MVVAPGLSPAELQRALAALIDPAFLPAPLGVRRRDPAQRNQQGVVADAPRARGVAGRCAPKRRQSASRPSFAASDPVFAGHFPAVRSCPAFCSSSASKPRSPQTGVASPSSRRSSSIPLPHPGNARFRIVCTSEGEARFEIERGTTRSRAAHARS
jgi:hypothetical protein